MRLLQTVIEREPAHLAALNTLALIALNGKDAAGAVHYLERAVAVEPGAPGIWFNLFQAQDLAGDPEAGLASLDRALAIDGYYIPAVAMKAATLAGLGRREEAVTLFRAVLGAKPALAGLPEPVREALSHGAALVEAEDEARAGALAAPLEAIYAAHPDADFSRARAYAEQRTGRRQVYVQQPVGGHFPYLPALEFFPEHLFPWFAELEAATDAIRGELLGLIEARDRSFRPYVAFDPTQPVNQWGELNHSPRWSAWFFWEDGVKREENCARCPATAALLEGLPLLDLPGKGPTTLFS
ncbi:MAG TPA: aspartyl/asparaginyl beta-hydroxylase domain-containing protein, partial [Allosphingosinicella sp.]|nr:aspartyl/asparaginyl beta-hydroxylase domain-containing protein [Allosphingosinicella sp.]